MTDERFEHGKAYRTGRDALTESEIERVINALMSFDNKILLELAISTGMRRDDVVNVRVSDIHNIDIEPNRPAIKIAYWEKKRRRTWVAIVFGRTAQDVLGLIDSHKRLERLKTPWLFPSPRNPQNHLSSRQAYNIFHYALKAAGLRLRPFHALRATCMKQCKRMGWTIEQTMELTGDSFRTVQEHYLTPSEDEMMEIAEKAPLIGYSKDDRFMRPLIPEGRK